MNVVTDLDVAFAKQAADASFREALLATLADDAVLFQPRAMSGRVWASSAAVPAGRFTWSPAWAAVAADGSIGVTSGPIAFSRTGPDSSSTGQYVTIWTRFVAQSPLKAFLHLMLPGPQASTVAYTPHLPAGDGRPRGGPGAIEASKATLFIADRGLAAAMKTDDPSVALPRVALPDSRLLRAGAFPVVGPDSIRAALAATDAGLRMVWQTADVRMARSGDLGFAYGVYEKRNAAEVPVEAGNFVRVWERQPDGGWRILLDAAAPFGRR